jgi:signal transduction histidine kinase
MASTSEMVTPPLLAALTFGEFYEAIFADPEVAAYVIRVGDAGDFTFEDANAVVERISGKPLAQIRGYPPAASMPADIAECLTNNLRRCVETSMPVSYRRACEVPGGKLSFQTSLTPIVRLSGSPRFIVGMTRDVTHETALVESAQHHAALLKTLGIAVTAAVYMLDLETRTLKFIGGEASASQLEWRKGAEEVGPKDSAKFFHPDDWPRVEQHWTELAALPDGEVATVSYRLLASDGEYRRHVNREVVFGRDSEGKVKLVLGVSEDVSEHDRMEQEVRDLSARILTLQIDERRRIAHELHDSTGQHLTAATLALGNVQMMRRAAGAELPDALLAAIDDAAACIGEAHREIRVLSYLLHPPQLLSQGLAEALHTFANGFGRRARLKIAVDVAPGASAINDDTAVHLFRICQEALTNVYRHADARKAHVTLNVDQTAIQLVVRDDGIGFDDSATEEGLGVGLSGMRDRIARLGGKFEIGGDPGGTTLIATLPWSAPGQSTNRRRRLGGAWARIQKHLSRSERSAA